MVKKYFNLTALLFILILSKGFAIERHHDLFSAAMPGICFSEDGLDLPDTLDIEQYIDALQDIVKSNNRFIGALSADRPYSLPIGLHKSIGGIEYMVVLDDLRVDRMGAWLSAYMSLEFPGVEKPVGFYTDSVRITANGIQTAQLKMISDRELDLGGVKLVLRKSETSVEWDCNGYVSTTLDGEIIMANDLLIPVNNGIPDPTDTLSADFNVFFEDVSNLMASITLPQFQIQGAPDMTITPGQAALDLSDFQNPDDLEMPAGYFSDDYTPEMYSLWRGVYIHSFTVELPGEFTNNNTPVTISAERLMIDNNGITGGLFADSVITFENGEIGGWQFSLDRVGFSLLKNNFADFQFNGQIVVPISEEEKSFAYEGLVDDAGELMFAIENVDSLKADLWAARLALAPNSTVMIEKEGQNYYPKAILHGSMEIALSSTVQLASFSFQSLEVSSREPYLTVGTFGMPSGMLSGFPVNISTIEFVNEGSSAGIKMAANVNFMGDGDGGFSGDGGFTIWAEKVNNRWQYDNFQMQKVSIGVDQGAYEFYGELNFYQQHEVFGKGFKGMVQAKFAAGIEVEASLQLGNVNDYRYWYADALLVLPSGIVIFPGAALYGFGGGISYHMEKTPPLGFDDVSNTYTATDETTDPGTSLSGAAYLPNNEMGLGLSAKVVFGTNPNPNAFNGAIELGFQFYASGGLESIRFIGEAVVMAELNSDPEEAKVGAEVDIMYSFSNSELYGVSTVYVNIPNIVTGANANNSAGSITTYFSDADWFVYAGTPDNRIALEFINLIETNSYLMVGTDIPDFPALPDEVASLADENVQQQFQGLMGSGRGFAFGSMFQMNTGEQEFLIFFGSFDIGAGFDIMVQDLGTTAHCEDRPAPIGINGWYAMGQTYAFLDGEIGIKVKLFGNPKKFTILNVGAAALLQTALPNPLYMRGAVEGHYSILSGAISGQCSYEFSIGEMCEISGGMGEMNMIAEISPGDGEEEVDVFAAPRVAFNYVIGQTFELMDTDGQTKNFRIVLNEFSVNTGASPYPGQMAWNDNHNVVSYESTELLPSEQSVTVSVSVQLEVMANDEWEVYMTDGSPQQEEMEITFTSGVRPDYIPESQVEYMYPLKNMENFYWKEHNQGFIQCIKNFDYLFENEAEWDAKVIFDDGSEKMAEATYDESLLRVNFNIPQNLNSQKVYEMRIAKIPVNTVDVAVDEGVVDVETVSADEYTQVEQEIEETRSTEKDRVFHRYNVRTSKYSKLAYKLNAWDFTYDGTSTISTGIDIVYKIGNTFEPFSQKEIDAFSGEDLIDLEFQMTGTYWYNNHVEPVVYHNYPVDPGVVLTNRNPNILGVPPSKSCSFTQDPYNVDITGIAKGTTISATPKEAYLLFDGIPVIDADLLNLRSHAAELLSIHPNHPERDWLIYVAEHVYSNITLDRIYNFKVRYILPDGTQTSESLIPVNL